MAQRTRRYLIRRAVVVLLTLFAVTLLSFLLMRLSPIDPATAYVKRNSAVVTQEQIDEARVMLGLDKPLPVQYFDWVVDALHMDFGISLGTGNSVTEELAKTVPVIHRQFPPQNARFRFHHPLRHGQPAPSAPAHPKLC